MNQRLGSIKQIAELRKSNCGIAELRSRSSCLNAFHPEVAKRPKRPDSSPLANSCGGLPHENAIAGACRQQLSREIIGVLHPLRRAQDDRLPGVHVDGDFGNTKLHSTCEPGEQLLA